MQVGRTSSWLVIGTAVLALFGCNNRNQNTAAAAAPAAEAPGAQDPTGPRGRLNPLRFLQRFDRNGSGTVELTELPARLQERLRGADSNNDGTITTEELAAVRGNMRNALFARMDSNSDGALTADEVGQRWARISAADSDSDGRVTRAELEQAFASGALFRRGAGAVPQAPTAPTEQPAAAAPTEQPAAVPTPEQPAAVETPTAAPAEAVQENTVSTEELEAAQ